MGRLRRRQHRNNPADDASLKLGMSMMVALKGPCELCGVVGKLFPLREESEDGSASEKMLCLDCMKRECELAAFQNDLPEATAVSHDFDAPYEDDFADPDFELEE